MGLGGSGHLPGHFFLRVRACGSETFPGNWEYMEVSLGPSLWAFTQI